MSTATLALPHGPYHVNAGLHQQDEPTGVMIKVAKVENNFLTDESGKKHELTDNGTKLTLDDRRFSAYRRGRKVTPVSLSEGDEVELAEQRTYGPATTPPSLRREGVRYEPFRAAVQLHDPKLRHNRPGSIKFSLAHDLAQGDEISRLQRENEELRRALADKAKQIELSSTPLQPEQPQKQEQPQSRQQPQQGKKLVP